MPHRSRERTLWSSPMTSRLRRFLVPLLLALLPVAVPATAREAAAPPDPAALRRDIEALRLEPARAVTLKGVQLDLGLADLTLEGTLVPASPVGGKSVELVFTGRGRITLAPPDAIEAGQVELFTGAPQLDEEFQEAVLVVGLDAAVQALLARPRASLDADAVRRAEELYVRFQKSTERRILGVEGAILVDALGDPSLPGYFAGWFRGSARKVFYYVIDPDAREQQTLGQFIPLDATENEKRKLEKRIHREQRQGRLIGLKLEDLGQFDTWLSAPLTGRDGKPHAGVSSFEAEKYTLDVTLSDKLEIVGRAKIDLAPVVLGSRVVALRLANDLAVQRVTDVGGTPLFFQRAGSDLTIVLPHPPAEGTNASVTVEYGGPLLVKENRNYTLLDPLTWYPSGTELGNALYDVTLHWPRKLDLMASGRRTEGGEKDGRKWERRVFDRPSFGFGLEVGRYRIEKATAGHVQVTLAFDPRAPSCPARRGRRSPRR
jgi:hypothetical protein